MADLKGYDSTSASDCPRDGDVYFAYCDGRYSNVADFKRLHPGKPVITITVEGKPGAQVADCETGLLTVAEAVAWAAEEHKAGGTPCIYCNASTWPTVRAAVAARGLEGHVEYAIAHYDGDPTIPAGAVAKQYKGSPGAPGAPGTASGHFDEWSVKRGAFGTAPVKPRTPLSQTASVAVSVLIRHLTKRTHRPTAHATKRLNDLAAQIRRVENL